MVRVECKPKLLWCPFARLRAKRVVSVRYELTEITPVPAASVSRDIQLRTSAIVTTLSRVLYITPGGQL